MHVSVHINEKLLDFLRTYPGKTVWLDIQPTNGTIEVSRDDKTVFHKDKGTIIYVPTDQPTELPNDQ